jgi:hypothetical protein
MLNNGAFLVMQVAVGAILGVWHRTSERSGMEPSLASARPTHLVMATMASRADESSAG